jgi:hypothetical protein
MGEFKGGPGAADGCRASRSWRQSSRRLTATNEPRARATAGASAQFLC